MILGRVAGSLVASEKHPKYEGAKILWVRPLDASGEPAPGDPFLAIDTVGAGSGERVLVVVEGGAAIAAFRRPMAPLDAAVVGIVDAVGVPAARV
ncbi:MAG: EutN/CcmL family microcompartment protein [Acidobacteriota bacterium]